MNCLAQRWRIGGHVQGVGFRPYVYRLAHQHGLAGWVRNDGGLVEIHAQGPADQLQTFGAALLQETPASASARLIEVRPAAAESRDDFRILDSTSSAETQVHVTSRTAMSASRNCAIHARGAIAIRSSTARSAARATR